MKTSTRMFAALALASAVATSPALAQVTVGTPNTVQPNSYPFGYAVGFTTFQQVYSSSLFSAPINIGAISLYNSLGTGTFQRGTFNLFLSTTTVAPGAVTNTPSNNRTGPLQAFATVTYGTGENAPGIVTFTGTPYMYDPTGGNLLFEVQFVQGGATFNPRVFLDRVQTGDPARNMVGTASNTSPVFGTNGSPNSGFVTTFTAASTVVPEPSTWALMGFGLIGLGAAARRKRSAATVS